MELVKELIELYDDHASIDVGPVPAGSCKPKVGYGDVWDEAAEAERLSKGLAQKLEQQRKKDTAAAALFAKLASTLGSESKDVKAKLMGETKLPAVLTSALLEVGDLDADHTEAMACVAEALTVLQFVMDCIPVVMLTKGFTDGLRVLKKKLDLVLREIEVRAAKAEAERLIGIINLVESKHAAFKEDVDSKYSEVKSGVLEEKVADVSALAQKFLSERRVQYVDLTSWTSYFETDYTESATTVLDKKRMNKIKKDLTVLEDALPDGIYVFVNEDRFDKMIVQIAGPEDTPYEYGSFLFDLYLPPEFPSKPPKMNLINNGNFRFNPNLYTGGYVCFSLLGTWDGPGWDSTQSTLLQLLVSLQAMVLCQFPYCNEPGWEDQEYSPVAMRYHYDVTLAKFWFAIYRLLSGDITIPAVVKSTVMAYTILNKDKIAKSMGSLKKPEEESYPCYSGETELPGSLEDISKRISEMLPTLKLEDS